jgi:hypothetical protein
MANGATLRANGRLMENRIDVNDQRFLSSVGSWYSADADLSVEYNDIYSPGYNALKIKPTTLGPVTVSFNSVRTRLRDRDDKYLFHCQLKSETNFTVTINVQRGIEEQSTSSKFVPAGRWDIVRSKPVSVPFTSDTYVVSCFLTFENHNGNAILLTIPVVQVEYAFTLNQFLRETLVLIPKVFTDADSIQTDPAFPMYRFMEIPLSYAGLTYDQFEKYKYRDLASGKNELDPNTLSGLVDPSVCERRFLPWLSQFNGVNLLDPVRGTTPWGNLPSNWLGIMYDIDPAEEFTALVVSIEREDNLVSAVLDEDVSALSVGDVVSVTLANSFNGQFAINYVNSLTSTVQWVQEGVDEQFNGGEVRVVDTSWIELEGFNTDITGIENYLRWQVDTGFYGVNSGSSEALVSAVQQILTGEKKVTVYNHYQGNPWQIKIFTKTSETPNGIDGESNDSVLAALQRAKPAGYQIVHECNISGADGFFILGDPENGVLGVSRL